MPLQGVAALRAVTGHSTSCGACGCWRGSPVRKPQALFYTGLNIHLTKLWGSPFSRSP